MTPAERFWAKVASAHPDECWLWTGGTNGKQGYGLFWNARPATLAHRFAYESAYGPIPKGDGYHGTCVMHTCDTRLCCNPTHLRLGSHAENMADMAMKGRAGMHARPGRRNGRARLSEAQVREIRWRYRPVYGQQTHLARIYGVSASTIRNIVQGETWPELV